MSLLSTPWRYSYRLAGPNLETRCGRVSIPLIIGRGGIELMPGCDLDKPYTLMAISQLGSDLFAWKGY